MATRVTVTYSGGDTEDIVMRPIAMVAAERQFGSGVSNGHSMEAMLWTAWFVKGKPAGSFDAWLDTIDDMQLGQEEKVHPLAEAPSPEASPS